MAKKKKPRGKAFAKGHKVNQGNQNKKGIASYDREELASRKIDAAFVNRYLTMNSHLTRDELRARLLDERITIFEERVIKSLLGEDSALSFFDIVNRLAGKVAEEHVHTLKKNKFDEMTTEELMLEKQRLSAENRKTLNFLEADRGLRPEQQSTHGGLSAVIDVEGKKSEGSAS